MRYLGYKGEPLTFKTASSIDNISKFCKIIQDNELFASWGIIRRWTDYKSRIPFIALAYLGDKPIGVAIVYRYKKTYVSTFVLKPYRRFSLGTRLYKCLPAYLREVCRIRVPRFECKDGRSAYYRAKNFYESLGKELEYK